MNSYLAICFTYNDDYSHESFTGYDNDTSLMNSFLRTIFISSTCLLLLSCVGQTKNTGVSSSQISQGSINEPVKRPPQEEENSVLPSEREILETNARLPVAVSEDVLFTKVEYDRDTKTERFYYRFAVDVDKQTISNSAIEQAKDGMKSALLKNSGSMARINAGMTYLYIYCSKDNKVLYEIRIEKSDF